MLHWLARDVHLVDPTLRTLLAILLSCGLVLATGGPAIRWLRRRKIGDNPDFDRADMNAIMADKRGTPTMGGVVIVGAIVATTLLLGDLARIDTWLAIATALVFAGLGATDDWLKLNRHRRAAAGVGIATRQGLAGKQKLIVQVTFGLLASWLLARFGDAGRLAIPFAVNVAIDLPTWAYVLWGAFVLTAMSNSVNLTDGLDGLAAGCTAIVAFALVIVALALGDVTLSRALFFEPLATAGAAAVVAGAVGGACLGFLWFNAPPARAFMGDTGSLALGGLLGMIGLSLRQELLLAIVGAIFVVEAFSVMLQVYYFKYTRIRFGEGRRIFRMSPLHHHFQKCGWTESQVVVRFWIVGALLAAVGVASLRLRW